MEKTRQSSLSNFTINVDHYKGIVIRKVSNIPLDKLDDFKGLVETFILKSQEDDATVDAVLSKIETGVEDKPYSIGLWLFEKDEAMLGYLFMETGVSDYGKPTAFVHNLYLSPVLWRLNIFEALDPLMVNWARSKGAKDIRFTTARSPRAFNKKLPSEWEPYGFVFNRPI